MLSVRFLQKLFVASVLMAAWGGVADAQQSATQTIAPSYDKTIFEKAIPSDQLAFLKQFSGATSNELFRDKQFRKLMKSFVPDCMFHYGRDMPLSEALDSVLGGSDETVQIRDERYLSLSGSKGPYLAGRGFLWIDLQDGVALGGFYFHPTNGEPTPSVNVFSRQVKDEDLAMSQLPREFAEDLMRWSEDNRLPPLTTRYFLTGSNKKVLLEHDEDYCSAGIVTNGGDACQQMNVDAADVDMVAASYLDQAHYATNATAWTIHSPEQIAWVRMRDTTCGVGPDALGCHIRMTRERTHVIIRRSPRPHR